MDPILGSIILFAGNFAPKNWALCNGQLLSITQNSALFSLLGTTYGGDGKTTFALPDLRGRAPVHFGQGNGLSPYDLGEAFGTETVTLLQTQMPQHSHSVAPPASTDPASQGTPSGAVPAETGSRQGGLKLYATSANAAMATVNSAPAGASQPHNNQQPYQVVNYIIALVGIYPTRP